MMMAAENAAKLALSLLSDSPSHTVGTNKGDFIGTTNQPAGELSIYSNAMVHFLTMFRSFLQREHLRRRGLSLLEGVSSYGEARP